VRADGGAEGAVRLPVRYLDDAAVGRTPPDRGGAGPRDRRRRRAPEGGDARIARLEEIVELQVLRLVVREEGRDRFLNQRDPLLQVRRHGILLGDPLCDLEVLLHGPLVDGEGEVRPTFPLPEDRGAYPLEGDPPVLRAALR